LIQPLTTRSRYIRIFAFVVGVAIAINAGDAFATTLLPPGSSTTMWSVASDRKTILLSLNGNAPTPFVIKGVDYSPRPIARKV